MSIRRLGVSKESCKLQRGRQKVWHASTADEREPNRVALTPVLPPAGPSLAPINVRNQTSYITCHSVRFIWHSATSRLNRVSDSFWYVRQVAFLSTCKNYLITAVSDVFIISKFTVFTRPPGYFAYYCVITIQAAHFPFLKGKNVNFPCKSAVCVCVFACVRALALAPTYFSFRNVDQFLRNVVDLWTLWTLEGLFFSFLTL